MKADAGFKCERCGAPGGDGPGHDLTTNRLTTPRGYMVLANLVVLCRHCQGRVLHIPLVHLANQLEMFDPFELLWLQPHLERLGLRVPNIPLITGASLDKDTLNSRSGEPRPAPRSDI